MRGYAHPSFSSTLLDSIYRSIDDDEEPSNLTRGAPDSRKKQTDYNSNPKWAPQAAVTRPRPHLRSAAAAPTSSSSSDSSYGGFSSSSEVEPVRLKPIRTADKIRPANNPLHPPPPAPKNKKEKVKRNLSSIRSKLRSPTSPAARLAGFLNSLFTHHHKPRSGEESSARSTAASSLSRSCVSTKTTPAVAASCNGAERSVTFRVPADGGGRKARRAGGAGRRRRRRRGRGRG
ncbi:uncharacterized protein M6B38_323265 [Iris pallida]|uniref:Uncharacterized protein n=1 Tax=Iris pallida TaxID=29817 RepID=A0AAX6HC09_IRIPA|nr:uncharacterized protein M6B38_323265 [Iris pallida]